jgi:hypothetical protein
MRPRLKRDTPGYGWEVAVTADIGAFSVQGRVDFAVILWREDRAVLRLVECKASRRDRTYHRIQTCIYKVVTEKLLGQQPSVMPRSSARSTT